MYIEASNTKHCRHVARLTKERGSLIFLEEQSCGDGLRESYTPFFVKYIYAIHEIDFVQM